MSVRDDEPFIEVTCLSFSNREHRLLKLLRSGSGDKGYAVRSLINCIFASECNYGICEEEEEVIGKASSDSRVSYGVSNLLFIILRVTCKIIHLRWFNYLICATVILRNILGAALNRIFADEHSLRAWRAVTATKYLNTFKDITIFRFIFAQHVNCLFEKYSFVPLPHLVSMKLYSNFK